jgi:Flp pilus assembly protein TadD
MKKQKAIGLSIGIILLVGLAAIWSASTTNLDGDGPANIISSSGAPTGESGASRKGGNRFLRVVKAPFKAFARLFSSGGRTDKPAADDETLAAQPPEVAPLPEAVEHLTRGQALLNKGQVDDAINELTQAASLGAVEAHEYLGAAYNRKGMHDRAKESYERALRAAPNDPQIMNNLGYTLYLKGNYRAAVDRLMRAAALAPKDQRILNNLALAQFQLGKYNDAYKNFARAGGEFNGHVNIASMLERQGREDEAIKHYEAARRLQPTSVTVTQRLIDLYQRTGRRDEADEVRRSLIVSKGRGKWIRSDGGAEESSAQQNAQLKTKN